MLDNSIFCSNFARDLVYCKHEEKYFFQFDSFRGFCLLW